MDEKVGVDYKQQTNYSCIINKYINICVKNILYAYINTHLYSRKTTQRI